VLHPIWMTGRLPRLSSLFSQATPSVLCASSSRLRPSADHCSPSNISLRLVLAIRIAKPTFTAFVARLAKERLELRPLIVVKAVVLDSLESGSINDETLRFEVGDELLDVRAPHHASEDRLVAGVELPWVKIDVFSAGTFAGGERVKSETLERAAGVGCSSLLDEGEEEGN
jgi:hypothetical protein